MEKQMPELNIGGREIPLYYSTYETIEIQRELGCTAFQLNEKVFGVEKIDDDKDPTMENIRLRVAEDPEKEERLGKLIRILGNAGLEENGQEPDLTDKWVMRHMKPAMILPYAVIAMAEIIEGNRMEKKQEEEKGPVDEGLEEELAKKQQGN